MNDVNNASSVGVLFWVGGRLPNRPADAKDAVLRGWDAPGRRVQRSYPETLGSPDIDVRKRFTFVTTFPSMCGPLIPLRPCSRGTQLLVLLHLGFCWQLPSDFPWGMVCSLFLDLGLDDIDLMSNLRNEGHRPSKKSAILSPNLETSLEKCQQMALPQDAQLCGGMNFFFKQHIFLFAPCRSLPHSLYLIFASFCGCSSMLEIFFWVNIHSIRSLGEGIKMLI